MEHRHADAAHRGRRHDPPVSVHLHIPYACHAESSDEDSERHKPGRRMLVAQPSEQRLDDRRRDIGREYEHGRLEIGVSAPHNEKRKDGGKGPLVDVGAHVPRHGEVVGERIAARSLRRVLSCRHPRILPHRSAIRIRIRIRIRWYPPHSSEAIPAVSGFSKYRQNRT